MFGKFNDEDYDGLVLKIPSWFIEMNGLESAIKLLHEKLSDCNKSALYSDHLNNLYELENREDKKKIVAEKKSAFNAKIEGAEKLQRMTVSGEIHQLEWVSQKASFDYETVVLNGERFCHDEIFTNGLNIKAEFEKKFRDIVKDYDSLKELSKQNMTNITLHVDMQYSIPEFFDLNYTLYCTRWMTLGIAYKRLMIKYDWSKGRKRGWLYRKANLIQFDDGCYAIANGGNVEDYPRLEGFKRQGLLLIKK